MTEVANRIVATDAALDAIERLTAKHGALMLFQSGGCCDGSSPMCYLAGEFRVGQSDVHLEDLVVEEIPEEKGKKRKATKGEPEEAKPDKKSKKSDEESDEKE